MGGSRTHDELNGTNEEHAELQDEVLLLLLHLVKTVSSSQISIVH